MSGCRKVCMIPREGVRVEEAGGKGTRRPGGWAGYGDGRGGVVRRQGGVHDS